MEVEELIFGVVFGAIIIHAILFCLFFFVYISPVWEDVVYPSYLSVATQCQPAGDQILKSSGYVVGGYYDPKSDEITIVTKDTQWIEEVTRHELCHKKQNYEGRYYYCDNEFFMFLNELECKLVENGYINMDFSEVR